MPVAQPRLPHPPAVCKFVPLAAAAGLSDPVACHPEDHATPSLGASCPPSRAASQDSALSATDGAGRYDPHPQEGLQGCPGWGGCPQRQVFVLTQQPPQDQQRRGGAPVQPPSQPPEPPTGARARQAQDTSRSHPRARTWPGRRRRTRIRPIPPRGSSGLGGRTGCRRGGAGRGGSRGIASRRTLVGLAVARPRIGGDRTPSHSAGVGLPVIQRRVAAGTGPHHLRDRGARVGPAGDLLRVSGPFPCLCGEGFGASSRVPGFRVSRGHPRTLGCPALTAACRGLRGWGLSPSPARSGRGIDDHSGRGRRRGAASRD
jgi:hypothetical protein